MTRTRTIHFSLRQACLATSMLGLFALTSWLNADEPPAPSTPPPPTTAETNTPSPFVLRPVRPPFAKGPIRELDPARKTVTIETRDGLLAFTFTDRTQIFRGPDKLRVNDLVVGDIVAVRFVTNADDQRLVSHAKVYPNPQTNTKPIPDTALPSP